MSDTARMIVPTTVPPASGGSPMSSYAAMMMVCPRRFRPMLTFVEVLYAMHPATLSGSALRLPRSCR